MAGREKLEGQYFKDMYVVKYIGDKKYLCQCTKCGEQKELYGTNIKKLVGVTCSMTKVNVDLEDQYIGEWHVLKYIGNKKYLCRCSCGVEKEVLKVNLMNGSSTSCGHNRNSYGDLTGKHFGEWEVIEKAGYKWKCRCSCGKIGYNMAKDLVSGRTKSCGHNYFIPDKQDIIGKRFGNWLVKSYYSGPLYECQCQCENKTMRYIRRADLLDGSTTSCGCNRVEKGRATMAQRYGETAPNKVANPRTPEQLNAIKSKESLAEFIGSLSYKPTSMELASLLGMQLHRTLTLVHSYELDDMIILQSGSSHAENEIYEYIKKIYKGFVIQGDRKVLHGKELDIYIPEKKLAIEYNGSYWHSTIYKDKYYHQQKTIACARQGIRLISIYEYEWNDIQTATKLQRLLYKLLSTNLKVIPASDLSVREIDIDTAHIFQLKYHLMNSSKATINIGAFDKDNTLVAVASFDKPRINNNYDYELLRYCTKTDVSAECTLEKLFSYFTKTYNPQSVLTYSDISKFAGNSYTKIGFTPVQTNPITEPNYKWVSPTSNDVLSRYQTQKYRLLEQGLGTEDQTEDEIMEDNNYFKIYDCGSIALQWTK
jgi:hypothetical protein